MEERFDPYRKWLGIPDSQQPPTHYRLLGIDLFESDPETIQLAADRQMAFVRNFQAGSHAADSRRICSELTVALRCLLDLEKRSQYDEELRLRLNEQKDDVERAAGAVEVAEGEMFSVAEDGMFPDGIAATSSPGQKIPKAPARRAGSPQRIAAPSAYKKLFSALMIVGGGGSGILIAAGILWAFGIGPWAPPEVRHVSPPNGKGSPSTVAEPAAQKVPPAKLTQQPVREVEEQKKTSGAPPAVGPEVRPSRPDPGAVQADTNNPFKVIPGSASSGNGGTTSAQVDAGKEVNPFQEVGPAGKPAVQPVQEENPFQVVSPPE